MPVPGRSPPGFLWASTLQLITLAMASCSVSAGRAISVTAYSYPYRQRVQWVRHLGLLWAAGLQQSCFLSWDRCLSFLRPNREAELSGKLAVSREAARVKEKLEDLGCNLRFLNPGPDFIISASKSLGPSRGDLITITVKTVTAAIY